MTNEVIIVTQNFRPEAVGGASRIYEMAKLLGQQLDQIRVVCPPPTYPFGKYKKTRTIFSKEIIDRLQIVRIWTFQPSRSTRSSFQRILYYSVFSILVSFYLFARCHNASYVIVSVPPSSLLVATLVARIFRKKIIIDVRDLWVEAAASLSYIKKDSIVAIIAKRFEEYCWRKADRLLTNSMVIYDLLSKTIQDGREKIKYFPFNVDLNTFKKTDTNRKKQIVYIGNLGVAQNLRAFVSAAPSIIKAFPDLKIQFYGGGDCEAEIRKQVNNLGIEESLEVHDPIPRELIPRILSQSLVGIVPLADNAALRYAIPTKTFEYFASNLPVVAYGTSDELERVITNSEAGVYIKGNSPQAIADAVIALVTDKSRHEEYAANGRKFVERNAPSPSFLLD